MEDLDLQREQLEFSKAQLQHSIEMFKLQQDKFKHESQMQKLQALMGARDFAHNVVKKQTWGQELQEQLEQLTREIFPISKIIQ